ncbi:MAG: hypothetical protein ACJ8FV_21005 [Xanthobacteraceae bacterium]
MTTTDAILAALRYVYRCAVTVAALVILYAVVDVLRQGEPNPSAWALLAVVGALAVAAAVAAWSRHSVAVSVQTVAIPFLAAVYVFEVRQRDPIDEMLHVSQFWDLVKARQAQGPISIQYSPTNFLRHPDSGFTLPGGDRVFVVAPGAANVQTIMCREGARPFAEYDADEHGFNNPRGIWGKPVDLVFIGDSMTYGACVANRDHFIAQVREKYPASLNLGVGGIGPLIELAIVREFVPHVRPKYVFYVYDENNDLYFVDAAGTPDLANEYHNAILRSYLTDDRFSQRLYERRPEVHAILKQYLDSVIAQSLETRAPHKLALKFLSLPLTRASLPPITWRLSALLASTAAAAETESDDFELFKKTFTNMLRTSADAGARFVFVNIPAQVTVCNGVNHPLKKPVLDFVAQSGVDVIDLEQDYRDAIRTIGREKIFAVPPCGGHFSELGYKIVGDRLLNYLQMQDAK